MWRNYFLIAYRNLSRNLIFTTINVTGLAIGLAGCLLVTLYLQFELSYENFHSKKDHLYRYIAGKERDGEVRMQTFLPAGFAPLMKDQFREVEYFSRLGALDDYPLFKNGSNTMQAKFLAMADPDFFKMFDYAFKEGDRSTVLDKPFSIAISESVAQQAFPKGDALGKVIQYDGTFDFVVTGVFKDFPANTHISFSYLISFESCAKIIEQRYKRPANEFLSNLDAWNFLAYFYIPGDIETTDLATRMENKFIEAQKSGKNTTATDDWLQPLGEIHFTKGIRGDTANGNINYIYIFSAVSLLILLIACFNFTNLSIARAIKRSKEVGLRKVIGAMRFQLIKQFFGETIILIVIAMIISVIMLELLVPLFNGLMGLPLEIHYFGTNGFVGILLIIGSITALLAGGYPALYLSSFKPAEVLKGKTGPLGNSALRKVLTTLQFSAAIFLLIATMAIFAQMRFIRDTDLGFDQERIIFCTPPSVIWNRADVFKQSLLANAGVKSVTFSNGTPGMESSTFLYDFPGLSIPEKSVNTLVLDYDYLETFGLDIVEGRNLSREHRTDSAEGYLVNEAMVRDLFLDKPIGTSIRALDGHPPARIVGVVKDFHYRSLHRKIEPLVLRIDPRNMWCMSIKLGNGDLQESIAAIEKEWKKAAPGYPFSYDFVDDIIEKQYKSEKNAGVMLSAFTLLAIVIACLGLLALTSFMTEQRRKEIGVRKVLGASIPNIILLLSRDFSKLMLIAFVVVTPLSWYAIQQWMSEFAYQTEINPLIYFAAGFIIAVIAWTSIAYQAFKAARINPSETLRSE